MKEQYRSSMIKNHNITKKKKNYGVPLTLSQTTNLRLLQTPRVSRRLMQIAESSPKWVENTVEKGEIACYEQFLLFPQCFRKTCTADT